MQILLGILIGLAFGYFITKARVKTEIQTERETAQEKFTDLDKQFVAYKAKASEQLETATNQLNKKQQENSNLSDDISKKSDELLLLNRELATVTANSDSSKQAIEDRNSEIRNLKAEVSILTIELDKHRQELATVKAQNVSWAEKLDTQKNEIETLGKKFNMEFENIANKILETKTEKFTELNKNNLKDILEPLGKNIDEFKKQVNDVYKTESNERFSLGEKVKELAELNQVISEEAKNLTKALKGEAKTQGRWGEMILESILEKSGLRKNEQYFLDQELLDDNGNALRSDSEGKKMRPDVVIKYPDNRNIIIDSKVSLNAFTRLLETNDVEEQKKELDAHVAAIKHHINALSTKGYDDYDKSLDFVMMFVPSEPAYIAALQGDSDLWNFAYDKRILLINPTNLIASLKLIVNLWKREHQNQNALEIAERGAKLYDKFVGFVNNLEDVGGYIEKAQVKYNDAYKQLCSGNDNLVTQATKLKDLGLKTKKELPNEMVKISTIKELPDFRQ